MSFDNGISRHRRTKSIHVCLYESLHVHLHDSHAPTHQAAVLDLLLLGHIEVLLVLAHAHGVKQATCRAEQAQLLRLGKFCPSKSYALSPATPQCCSTLQDAPLKFFVRA